MIGPSILGVSEGHADTLTGVGNFACLTAGAAAESVLNFFVSCTAPLCRAGAVGGGGCFPLKDIMAKRDLTGTACIFPCYKVAAALILMDSLQGWYSSSCHGR